MLAQVFNRNFDEDAASWDKKIVREATDFRGLCMRILMRTIIYRYLENLMVSDA